MTKITVGTEFRSVYADSNPMWRVVKARGKDTWNCVIVESEDYGGQQRVFGGEEIRRALARSAFWTERANTHDDWWSTRRVGEIVHYHNGFRQYVRGVIVVHNDKKMMKPMALVGDWKPYDLPKITVYGELVMGYQAEKIARGEPFQPNEGNMVEGSYKLSASETYPRTLPAIDLTPPKPNAAQKRAGAYYRAIQEIREALNGPHAVGPDGTAGDSMKAALDRVREILNEPWYV